MSSIKSINKHSQLKKLLKDNGVIGEGSSPTITPLKGGLWNDVYRVKTTSKDMVVKDMVVKDLVVKSMQEDNNQNRLYPNQPKQEMETLKLLEGLNIAPKFVKSVSANQADLLIYEFSPGEMLTTELNIQNKKPLLSLVAELFAKQHKVQTKSIRFRKLPTKPKEMMLLAENLMTALSDDENTKQLKCFEERLKSSPLNIESKKAFVHTDAWAGNFIIDTDKNSLTLIDWQCPAIGDATFDIWTFAYSGYNLLAGKSLFSDEEKLYFIEQYKLYSEDETFDERLEVYKPFYSYRIAAHACQRIVALKQDNPKASFAFQRIFNLQLSFLEKMENSYG